MRKIEKKFSGEIQQNFRLNSGKFSKKCQIPPKFRNSCEIPADSGKRTRNSGQQKNIKKKLRNPPQILALRLYLVPDSIAS